MELGLLNPAWMGCFLTDETLTLDNRETFSIQELRYIRWELNNWRRIAQANQRAAERSGDPDAVVFSLGELVHIREILKLLDCKLPGYSLRQAVRDEVLPRSRLRRG